MGAAVAASAATDGGAHRLDDADVRRRQTAAGEVHHEGLRRRRHLGLGAAATALRRAERHDQQRPRVQNRGRACGALQNILVA